MPSYRLAHHLSSTETCNPTRTICLFSTTRPCLGNPVMSPHCPLICFSNSISVKTSCTSVFDVSMTDVLLAYRQLPCYPFRNSVSLCLPNFSPRALFPVDVGYFAIEKGSAVLSRPVSCASSGSRSRATRSATSRAIMSHPSTCDKTVAVDHSDRSTSDSSKVRLAAFRAKDSTTRHSQMRLTSFFS